MSNLIGQSLGRYHLLEELGEGGMATVYRAFDTRLEREVAVKIIRRGAFPPQHLERILKRFEREAKVLAGLTHPNIVTVLDSGEQDGMPFLVMEYIPAGTLKENLHKAGGKPVPWQEATKVLAPVARALEFAHQHKARIVHRDVKPSNILITKSGTPMLSDFGIAKILEGDQAVELTSTGAGIGTPEYMAPEQATNRDVDHRADVYALGVVLYEMVTGRKPYQADTPMAVMIKKATEPLPRPKKLVPGLPDAVEHVLLKALARNPEDRFGTMGGFAEALERLGAGLPPNVVPPRTGPESVSNRFGWLRSGLIFGGVGVSCLLVIAGAAYGLRQLNQVLGQVGAEGAATAPLSRPTKESSLPGSAPTSVFIVPTPIDVMISIHDEAELVYVPEGEFLMGSDTHEPYFWGAEAPKHTVLLDAFWIYRTEVTNAMYRACVDAGACPRPAEEYSRTHGDYYTSPKYDDYPVIYLKHEGALSYCIWAGARLPTEAEWEKAARGTDGRLFPWANENLNSDYANFCDVGCPNTEFGEIESSFDDGYRDLAPVGSFPRGVSPYSAYDMAGNALEWVADWMGSGYYSQSPYENPLGPPSGSKRVIKGGSWYSGRAGLRPAARASLNPKDAYDTVGFRCAVDAQ